MQFWGKIDLVLTWNLGFWLCYREKSILYNSFLIFFETFLAYFMIFLIVEYVFRRHSKTFKKTLLAPLNSIILLILEVYVFVYLSIFILCIIYSRVNASYASSKVDISHCRKKCPKKYKIMRIVQLAANHAKVVISMTVNEFYRLSRRPGRPHHFFFIWTIHFQSTIHFLEWNRFLRDLALIFDSFPHYCYIAYQVFIQFILDIEALGHNCYKIRTCR